MLVVAIVGAIIVTIFVGYNLHHAKTMRQEQSGEVAPRDAPKSPTDLQSSPPPPRQ